MSVFIVIHPVLEKWKFLQKTHKGLFQWLESFAARKQIAQSQNCQMKELVHSIFFGQKCKSLIDLSVRMTIWHMLQKRLKKIKLKLVPKLTTSIEATISGQFNETWLWNQQKYSKMYCLWNSCLFYIQTKNRKSAHTSAI